MAKFQLIITFTVWLELIYFSNGKVFKYFTLLCQKIFGNMFALTMNYPKHIFHVTISSQLEGNCLT